VVTIFVDGADVGVVVDVVSSNFVVKIKETNDEVVPVIPVVMVFVSIVGSVVIKLDDPVV